MEQAHGVGAAADRRDQRVRQAAVLGLGELLARLIADDRLEVAHHGGIGMRAGDGADDVEGVGDIGDPVAQRLVHRILQGARAALDRHHLGAQQAHAEDIGLLALHVDLAHIDRAGQAEEGGDGGGGDAMLAGAGLGDDAGLAHAPGQQDLAHAIVDLMRAGVVQLVALQIDLGAAEMPGQPLGEEQRARPADIMLQVIVELLGEGGIRPSPCHRPPRARA